MIEIKMHARTPAEAIVLLAAVQDVLDKKAPKGAKDSAAPVESAQPVARSTAAAAGEVTPGAADPIKTRAPRADKGVKRGSYKNAGGEQAQTAAPQVPTGTTSAPSTNAAAPSESTGNPPQAVAAVAGNGGGTTDAAAPNNDWPLKTPGADVPTDAEVQKAIEAAHGRTSTQTMMDMFARFTP